MTLVGFATVVAQLKYNSELVCVCVLATIALTRMVRG